MLDVDITDADIGQFLADNNEREEDSGRHLCFDDARRTILKNWRDVQACPGSGKTTLVASKLLILANKLNDHDGGICVLTHTNVACHEIRTRLESHPSGVRLTSYPNFIGTIQEFVNKFLALPYIRSLGLGVSRVDDEASFALMDALISPRTRGFLERKRADVSTLKISHIDGESEIPGFDAESNSQSYRNLVNALHIRVQRGYFFYSEMYYFAKACLKENPEIAGALRERFPIVMLDEMQDTQEFQDDLLNGIFSNDDVRLQRFGDPDQAIYDNMGGENTNSSFNDTELEPVNSTHRFSSDISSKIHGLSLTKIGQLQSFRPDPEGEVPHTFFLYTDETKTTVLESFCVLLEEVDPLRSMSCAKAVGATEGGGGFISEYWSEYDRRKSVNNPKPESLIEAVRKEWWVSHPNAVSQYELLVRCVLDILRIGNVLSSITDPPRHHTKTSLTSKLKADGQFRGFRKILARWISESCPDEESWAIQVEELMIVLGIDERGAILAEYLSYIDFEAAPEHNPEQTTANIYRACSGREVEVGTIHSVKGETHDATLVLETKNHQFDIEILVNNISLEDSARITAVRKSKFARLLYVAASRPKTLLCFAAHQERINNDQREALQANGWRVSLV